MDEVYIEFIPSASSDISLSPGQSEVLASESGSGASGAIQSFSCSNS